MNNIIGSNDVVYNKWYKPADWTDIQTGAVDNSINLLVGVVSDFSAYDNLGFKVTCVGGYDVYIDGELFGQYLSTGLCTITWSTYSATEGSTTTYPTNLITHEVSIRPTVPDTAMTKFNCERITAVTPELQGILWAYFNITNVINLLYGFGVNTEVYRNQILESVTAKNNILNVSGIGSAFRYGVILKHIPVLNGDGSTMSGDSIFSRCYVLKYINIKNIVFSSLPNAFLNDYLLEKIDFTSIAITTIGTNTLLENRALKKIPNISFTGRTDLTGFITNAKSLFPMVLDVRGSTALTRIGCYGTATYFMTGFKGLRVSSSAPFTGTAPQINVSFTGMDRTALVQLFTDLATVTGKTISVVGCTGTASLTAEDLAIATDKGWTVTVA